MTKTTIDIILLVVMFVFFGLIFIQTFYLSETAGLVPKLTSGVAMVLCAVQLLSDLKKRRLEAGSQSAVAAKPVQLRWYYLLLLLISYIAGLLLIGFIPAVLLFLIITPFMMKQKKVTLNLTVAIIATVILYFAFVEVFNVRLPEGLLFDYLF